jgi:hypothetical protein
MSILNVYVIVDKKAKLLGNQVDGPLFKTRRDSHQGPLAMAFPTCPTSASILYLSHFPRAHHEAAQAVPEGAAVLN